MAEGHLTDAELEVLEHLTAATVAFAQLPQHHPTDLDEWVAEVHALQHRVMCRAAIRAHPEVFTPLETREQRERRAHRDAQERARRVRDARGG